MSSPVPDYLPKGGHFEEGKTEYVFECPKCGGNKFHWNLRRAQGFCFHCEIKIGSPRFLIYLLKGEVRPEVEKTVTLEQNVTQEFTVHSPIGAKGTEPHCIYLQSRGVPLNLAMAVGFTADIERNRIHAPIWSPFIKCPPSWKSRSILPGEKGWMSVRGDKNINYLFGAKYLIPKRIVLVEGVFDVLTPGLWGVAWAILGSNLGTDMEYWLNRQRFEKIAILLDPDAEEKAEKIEKRLRAWGANVVNLTGQYPEPGSCRNGELDFLKLDSAPREVSPEPNYRMREWPGTLEDYPG